MSGKASDFPFEIRDIQPDEKEELDKLFKEDRRDTYEYIRMGPKQYFFLKEFEKLAASIYNMELRPTDIIVDSFQRSGTTWTQELVWLVANNLDFEAAKTKLLVERYAFLEMSSFFNEPSKEYIISKSEDKETSITFMEIISTPATEILKLTPDPRFIKTHLPLSLLPPYTLDTTKVIYVARDPRDVIVSSYHHTRLFRETYGYKGEFKQFWDVFKKDMFYMTPYFEHVKEAWTQREHPNMLFLFYEELSKDLPASIRRVADFLGQSLTGEQMTALCEHLSIENFKNNKSVNFEEMRVVGGLASDETFIRSGKTGGWKEYFKNEMALEVQAWIDENLKNSDLIFPSMKNV